MRKHSYLAVFEPNGNGGFGVYFPDLPGCVSVGENFDNAVKMAEEGLGLHLYGMEQDGDTFPNPTQDPLELNIDEETDRNYIISMITVYPDLVKNSLDNRAVKTNTTLPYWLKAMAEARGINFSHLLQTALKEHLGIEK